MAVGQRKKVTHTGCEEQEATVPAHKCTWLFIHLFIHLITFSFELLSFCPLSSRHRSKRVLNHFRDHYLQYDLDFNHDFADWWQIKQQTTMPERILTLSQPNDISLQRTCNKRKQFPILQVDFINCINFFIYSSFTCYIRIKDQHTSSVKGQNVNLLGFVSLPVSV